MISITSTQDQKIQKYYDKKSATYDDYSNQLWNKIYDTATWNLIEPYIPKDSKATIFDAAGGTGKWAIPMAKCGPKVVLGDFSKGMLEKAKERINREGLQHRVEVKECDLRKLDFEDQTFDAVFCDHALCFIKEQETAVRELVRILKEGCPLIVSGQNRYVLALSTVKEDLQQAFMVLTKENQYVMHNSVDVYALSLEEFEHLLQANGLKVKKVTGKLFTAPLVLSPKQISNKKYSPKFYEQLLKIELELSNKPDATALGSHFQAIAYK